jgi:hypothetical protein
MSVECATQVEDMEVSLIEGMMVFSLIDRMDYSSSEEEDGFEDLFSLSIHRSEADSEEPSFGELFVKSGEEEKKEQKGDVLEKFEAEEVEPRCMMDGGGENEASALYKFALMPNAKTDKPMVA